MPEPLRQQEGLAAATRPRGVRLKEIRNIGTIDLRGDPTDRAFMSAVGRAMDLLLPTEPCGSISQGDRSALWLGPDEWLITCPRTDVTEVKRTLGEALGTLHAAITDVSAGRIIMRLSGPNARDLLAKGCPLDLHPRVVKPGYVAGSVLAKITALIHCRDQSSIDVYVARSYADYLWSWLEHAGREYGVVVD